MRWIRCTQIAAFVMVVMTGTADARVHYADSAVFVLSTPTSVENAGVPHAATIISAYPNPFNPSTTIRFEIGTRNEIHLAIYDLRGRLISILVEGSVDAGHHEVEWRGSDRYGRSVPSGVYFCRLVCSDATQTRKLILGR
ncbi:MAG: T9SS type A sorting domain-containing protein [bacterium]|nr:T9SS type A sorting domain-containing protein [bacterium]